jgi:hypothetical protein
MTSTRFTFARGASQLAWLLPLGLAGLTTACGSSPSMIGTSAGAAGASAGHASSSSASGGSGSDHAGAGATTAGGSAELGGASTGGATSSGGSSELGGASTGGATSGGMGGGSEVGACSTDKDCASGYNCLYKIADGCRATGSCFKMPGGALCASLTSYCGCLGQMVGVPCYDPSGYSPAPVTSQKSSATCPAAPDPGCVGKSCGAQCDSGEFPAACDPDGYCRVLFDASQCP